MNRNAPLRFVSSTVSQSASLIRIKQPIPGHPGIVDQDVHRARFGQNLLRRRVHRRRIATSTAWAQALRPSARTSAATFSEFSTVRDTQTTSAPSAANFKRDGAADAPSGAGHDRDLVV